MPDYAETISNVLASKLPGEVSHLKMLPENRKLKAELIELEKARHSSVLLLLFKENDDLKALLIKRPTYMKHHAGQIALPGGKIEKGESPLETAFRETHEEIGIEKEQIQILGELSPLYVQVSRFHIHPFVGWMENPPQCLINTNEVERTVIFPVRYMQNQIETVELETLTGPLNVPCIRFENEIIWGATAMILMEFSDLMSVG